MLILLVETLLHVAMNSNGEPPEKWLDMNPLRVMIQIGSLIKIHSCEQGACEA